jgi:DNA polymerase-3 subunit alpha
VLSLKNYTHYSLCQSICHPDRLIEKHKELGYTHVAITDYDSISGTIACIKEAEKANIHCIAGTTLSIKDESGSIVLLAYNLEGWQSLIKIMSAANLKENYSGKPQISLSSILALSPKGLICIIGGINSILQSYLFDRTQIGSVYRAETEEEVKQYINKDWVEDCETIVTRLRFIFGETNVYFESCLENIGADWVCNKAVRYLGKKLKIDVVPTIGAHYINESDWKDHHILLCSGLKTTLKSVKEKLQDPQNFWLQRFFNCSNYYVRLLEFPKNEMENLDRLEKRFEKYNIFMNPKLPKFKCPDGKTVEQYARELCRDGWKKKKDSFVPGKLAEYESRIKYELDLFAEIGILDYFLIVRDILQQCDKRGELLPTGRGSASGCLMAYLLDITQIDPVLYNLSSQRFYNPGRNTPGNVHLPDIDIDLMITKRHLSLEYLQQVYGKEKVGQVTTFQSLKGKGALKEILRINDAATFDQINKITAHIEDESKIAGDLEESRQAGENDSIIMWALKHRSNQLRTWCWLDDNDKCQGEYSRLFEQAMRLEYTLKARSTHAAAVIVSEQNLAEQCPMLFSKHKEDPVCGFEYEYLEMIGLLKFDLLGINVLDKIVDIQNLIKERYGKR